MHNQAFIDAENAAWGTWSKRMPDGSWVRCEEPEPIPTHTRRLYEPQTYTKSPDWEWTPVETPEDPKRTRKLEAWLGLSADDQDPYLGRAGRNMPEDSLRRWLDYAGYVLYARGRHEPYSAPQYKALKSRLKERTKKARQRSPSK